MARSKSNEDAVISIGADTRPFEKAMGEIQRSMTGRFKSGVGQIAGLGSGGALGVLSADTLLDNQLAESCEASQVLQPGSEDAAGTLRNIRQGFARHAIDINPSEVAQTFRSAADTMLTGKGGVEQMGEILTFAGLPTDTESLRYMQENSIDALAAYLSGGAQSKYKKTHPGLYRWALNQLGLTEVHQTFDNLGVGLGVREAMQQDPAGSFEGARAAYWTKLSAHGVGVDATRGMHHTGSTLARGFETLVDVIDQFTPEKVILKWKNHLSDRKNELNSPFDSEKPMGDYTAIDWWKYITKPNE